ncbi:MAG: hypothetical protein ACXAE3_03480 [Candidatus Kariarchaeaceae archaeon]|jgi:hypothetical protein
MVDQSTLRLIVFIALAAVGLLPTFLLYRYYYYTRILDYFLMGTAFIISLAQVFVIVLLEIRPQTLILFQINDFLYSLFIIMFLIHAMRIKWDRPPRMLLWGSVIWYLVVTIPIFFYQFVELPEEGWVGFLFLRNTSILETAQMFAIGDIYIIGRGFEFYVHAFRVYVVLVMFYTYYDTKSTAELMHVVNSRRIFLLAIFFAAVFPIIAMGEMLRLWTILSLIEWHIFDLFTFVLVAIITVRYPETLLISKTQIIRALSLQKSVESADPRISSIEAKNYLEAVRTSFPELFRYRKIDG